MSAGERRERREPLECPPTERIYGLLVHFGASALLCFPFPAQTLENHSCVETKFLKNVANLWSSCVYRKRPTCEYRQRFFCLTAIVALLRITLLLNVPSSSPGPREGV